MKPIPLNRLDVSTPNPNDKGDKPMTIAVLGASGLTGSEFCKIAIENNYKVVCIVRASSDMTFLNSFDNKFYETVRIDFENIENELTSDKLDGVQAAVSFFGTTLKQAGNKKNFSRIEINYNTKFASCCHKNNIRSFVLCSTVMPAFKLGYYLKTKDTIENKLIDLEFKNLLILRPGLILGQRKESRGALENCFSAIVSRIFPSKTCNTAISIAVAALDFLVQPSETKLKIYSASDINRVYDIYL